MQSVSSSNDGLKARLRSVVQLAETTFNSFAEIFALEMGVAGRDGMLVADLEKKMEEAKMEDDDDETLSEENSVKTEE